MSRVAWYVLLVNRMLQTLKSKQQITSIVWDYEGNGPDNLQCSIFQFLYSYNMFRQKTTAVWTDWCKTNGVSVVTPMKPQGAPWLLMQTGGPSKNNNDPDTNSSMDPSKKPPCFDWAGFKLQAAPGETPLTMQDAVKYQAAPEFYWFSGEDMGGDAKVPANNTMIQAFKNAGILPCFESSPDKPNFDKGCACRNSGYNIFGNTSSGGAKLLDVLSPLYQKYVNEGTMPAFSIEHLGNGNDSLNFTSCLNSANFAPLQKPPPADGTVNAGLVTAGKSYVDQCGVANFFGNWNETCFVSFLDNFVAYTNKLGRPVSDIMVYDAGFIPKRWFDDLKMEGKTNTSSFIPPATLTSSDCTYALTQQTNPSIADINACLLQHANSNPLKSSSFIYTTSSQVYNTYSCPIPNTPVPIYSSNSIRP